MAFDGVLVMGKSHTMSSPPPIIPFRLSLDLPLSQPMSPTGRFSGWFFEWSDHLQVFSLWINT